MAITRKREEPERPAELEDEESSRVSQTGEARPDATAASEEESAEKADVSASDESRSAEEAAAKDESNELATVTDEEEEYEEEDEGPVQLGGKRFVYAAYFAGAIAVAFMCSKAGDAAWTRLSLWKPQFGEPHDEIVMPVSAVVGGLTALYFWRDAKTRSLAEEVADELGKVTWPTKEQVTNGTAVVIVTTLFATIFFALMDRFWGFVTNLVYGS